MNVICMGGRTVGPAVAWDLVKALLGLRSLARPNATYAA